MYPDEAINSLPGRQLNGQCEKSTEVEQILRKNISQFVIKNANKEIKSTKPLIGAAGALALCYIARYALFVLYKMNIYLQNKFFCIVIHILF